MSQTPTIFVIEDDAEVREAIQMFLEARDYPVATFPSGIAYLEQFDPDAPGCLLLDVRMPGMSGLDLQEQLAAQPQHPPVIIITGHGDIPMAVRALNAGAFDFVQKPFNDKKLLEIIAKALDLDASNRAKLAHLRDIENRLGQLTQREREILDQVVAGKRNKVIAFDMQISQSTVESHRAHMMEKMGVNNLAELMRMMFALENS
jgi:FixJ family two-component response regulator